MDNRSAFGHLAAILRKAQGRIDAETGKAIDVGYECAKLREQFDALWAEVERLRADAEAAYNTLPGSYYMDPPDGGDVTPLEQLRRMAEDARRYRWLTENCLHSFSMTQEEPAGHTLVFEWCQASLDEAGWSIHDAIDAAIAEWEAG